MFETGVNIEDPKWQNLNTVDQVNRNHEINLMCWGNFEQTKVCWNPILKKYYIAAPDYHDYEIYISI